jgi:hypothetical protein
MRGRTMKFAILAILAAGIGAAWAQGPIPMRDGSTIIAVGGGCLVQYGGRGERINNAVRCSGEDIRQADRVMQGGGGPGYGGGPDRGPGPGYGGPMPGGSWMQSCRGGDMRGPSFHAECRTSDGRWNATMLDMRNCPSNVAENRNGSLVCR